MKPCDWYPYSSDDDVIYNKRHVATKLPNNARKNKSMNHVQKSGKPSSELAFERFINVLFNQTIHGPIDTFFIETFGRKHISDMINDFYTPDSDLYYKMKKSHLNKSDKYLISTLYLCDREFLYINGTPINKYW